MDADGGSAACHKDRNPVPATSCGDFSRAGLTVLPYFSGTLSVVLAFLEDVPVELFEESGLLRFFLQVVN